MSRTPQGQDIYSKSGFKSFKRLSFVAYQKVSSKVTQNLDELESRGTVTSERMSNLVSSKKPSTTKLIENEKSNA